jgi:hypothetical protein
VDHTGHEQMFKRRSWVSLVLSISALAAAGHLAACSSLAGFPRLTSTGFAVTLETS